MSTKKPISTPNHIESMTPAMVAPNTPGINGGAKGLGLGELTGLPTLVEPHKAVAEISKWETYRRGSLLGKETM